MVPTGAARQIAADAGALFDDDELIVLRSVSATGRSRAHLGGRSVPVGVLAQIGDELVTVHGQSDQVRLRAPAQQRAALDAFAGQPQHDALTAFTAAHRMRIALAADLEGWDAAAAERAGELARLQQALERIDAVEPVAGELTSLREEADRLGNVETLAAAAQAASVALDGDGSSGENSPADGNALTALESARRALTDGGHYDRELRDLADRLSEAIHIVNDVVTEVGGYASGLDVDPVRLEAVHQRRAALTDLLRTYAADAADAAADQDDLAPVLAYAQAARARVAELTAPGAGREHLLGRLDAARTQEQEAAAVVTANRLTAAARLSEQVDAELHGLQMAGSHLQIELTARTDLAAHGAEDVEFRLVPHPGAPARPLAKGASGGELSRIMLAIEVALASARTSAGDLPVFVFDEVDAGVGGQAATQVGKRLAELARHTQVVVVTHLAQVAALADTHLVVRKSSDETGTVTSVHAVSGTDREEEIARMLSGAASATARRHAAELLQR